MPSRRRAGVLRYWAERWQGIVLSLVVVVATLWLGLSGQLGLYIHPRYFVFTITMAVIGLVFVIGGFVRRRGFQVERTGPVETTLTAVGVALLLLMGAAMIVIPPTTLTSATATQREVNSGGLGTDDDADQAAVLMGTGDFEKLTVREWVSLLAQSSEPAFYADKTAQITGFVTPDANDPHNIFYVARFVVTCCAVDAQPIGVPVYQPGWQAEYEIDEWVRVTGRFEASMSAAASEPLAITPIEILRVDQPSEPYVY